MLNKKQLLSELKELRDIDEEHIKQATTEKEEHARTGSLITLNSVIGFIENGKYDTEIIQSNKNGSGSHMPWTDRELKSPQVLNSTLSEGEKEIIKIHVNSCLKERINPNGRGPYFDGIQTGIAQTLKHLGREDLWDLIVTEIGYHNDLY